MSGAAKGLLNKIRCPKHAMQVAVNEFMHQHEPLLCRVEARQLGREPQECEATAVDDPHRGKGVVGAGLILDLDAPISQAHPPLERLDVLLDGSLTELLHA